MSPNIATLVTSLDSAQNAMTLAYQGSQLAAQQAAVANKAHADAYNVYLNARDAMQKALKAVQDGIAGDYPVPAVQTPSSVTPATPAPAAPSVSPAAVATTKPVTPVSTVAAPAVVASTPVVAHTQAIDAVLASPVK